MKGFTFHAEAWLELTAAREHYLEISGDMADRFYEEMEALVAEVCERPRLRRVFDPPARRHFGSRFPYALIYLDRPDAVWIVAVMHFKQRPGYWKRRLG